MARLKLPRLTHNKISLLGAVGALIVGTAILLMFVTTIILEDTNPYFGIILYVVMPTALVFSLILIPIGMIREWRRWRRSDREVPVTWPIIDLNRGGHRNATIVFVVGTIVFVLVSSFGVYQAYHFSESVEFCGTTCHTVMNPQYTAYQNSPHAKVSCASCHVGYGADWYAKSKMSGAYQVYAALADRYPRPIPTPIENLRPAQETCEQCHWPEKTYGAQQRQFNHYMYDEENTLWRTNMLIKTGGGDPQLEHTSGIHWHMNIGVEIEYIARDTKRQDIPWVRITDKRTNRVTIYQDSENPFEPEEIEAGLKRKMDCLDCHNRPSHVFRTADYAIDKMIRAGRIDHQIPGIKRISVEAMSAEYPNEEEALRDIANYVSTYYRNQDDSSFQSMQTSIDKSIVAVQEAYSQNIFPEMKVRWTEYPNNIGHFTNIGCMRCHAGNHESEDGLTITRNCNACHTILAQGSGDDYEATTSPDGLEFRHPEDIDEAWREMGCHECHEGTQP